MKKFIAMMLVLFVGLTFAGCNNPTNALVNNIETNVDKLTGLLANTKEITEEDIVMKELRSSNSNYNVSNMKAKANKSNLASKQNNEKTNNDISLINKNVINSKNLKDVVETSFKPDCEDCKKIENMPTQVGKTQIVKNENPIAKQIDAKTQEHIDNVEDRSIKASSTFNLTSNKKVEKTNNTTKTQEIKKVAEHAVRNSTNSTAPSIKRLTTGSYHPRRVSEVDYNNDGLTNYISKIEDLYLMMNDAVCANNDCQNLKSNIIQNCDMLNMLCKQLKKKEIKLDDNQIRACNDLLSNLNKNTNQLNNTKNDVQTHCNAVKSMSINPNAKIEQVSSKYIKLINCLDERITYYSNILSLLTQLRCTINGVCQADNMEEALKIEENQMNENKFELPPILPETKIETNNENLNKNENLNDDKNLNNNKILNNDENLNNNKILNNDENLNNLDKNKENIIKNEEKTDKIEEKTDKIEEKTENNDKLIEIDKENASQNTTKINQTNTKEKLNRSRVIKNPIIHKDAPTSKDKDATVTLGDSKLNATNKTEKVADYNTKIVENSELPKHNLDTYREQTIKPNVGVGLNNRNKNTNNGNLENNNVNNNENNNIVENNNNQNNNLNNQENQNNANTQQISQNNNLNNNQNAVNNIPNNTNTMNNGLVNNGINNGIVNNGVNGTINNGVYNNGVNGAYGNGIISNGYGIHNYENGIMNPYRNTDTYKLPLNGEMNNGTTTIAKIEPLPSETRKDFKTFTKIA